MMVNSIYFEISNLNGTVVNRIYYFFRDGVTYIKIVQNFDLVKRIRIDSYT